MENGKFKNGIPVDAVSPHLRKWFYILDHLDDVLQNPAIYQTASVRFELSKIGESLFYKPDILRPIEENIKATILAAEKLIRRVFIVRWFVDTNDSLLTCVILCLLTTERTALFALKFQPDGGKRLIFWHTRNERKGE